MSTDLRKGTGMASDQELAERIKKAQQAFKEMEESMATGDPEEDSDPEAEEELEELAETLDFLVHVLDSRIQLTVDILEEARAVLRGEA